MSAENGTPYLTLAMTQVLILLLFWRASHKHGISLTTRRVIRFGMFVTAFNIVAQLALWAMR